IEHEDKEQVLYNILFPFVDTSQSSLSEGLVIATVRPEVVFADAAIAVNPSDTRYNNLIGQRVFIPLTNKTIPIIADDHVDIKFGTGCLQITPAHSHTDFELAKKHNLPVDKIELQNREDVVKQLDNAGFIKGRKKHTSTLAVCYRCKTVVEPTLSNQWFVKMEELAKRAKESLNNGLSIVPKKFEKIYLHWLNNIRDWCISRQITSGHKIPLDGETDVLDTWFSSALWPFCTLGWPDKTPDFEYFYPTNVMVMGYDILFFWAIRMVFSGLEYTDKLPFDTLIFHGLVRDIHGKKMSKSLGNGIDPLDAIEEFGADALRFSIISGTKLDRDPRYSIEKATLARNFINKIWNAVKFYIITKETVSCVGVNSPESKRLSIPDKWILTKLNNLIKSVTKKYEKYDLGIIANELQSFFWYDFCDFYLEAIKTVSDKVTSLSITHHVIINFLKLLHPIMPFITEEIFCNILKRGEMLATEEWPNAKSKNTWNKTYPKEKKEFDKIIELLSELKLQKKDAGRLSENPSEIERLANTYREKQIVTLQKEIERGEKVLSNQGFIARAPKQLVDEERKKLADNKSLLAKLAK
ncbi:MAG: class I tRNA ligase family protein, partial [Firmicutes bacterium]|nr:class I tRNA ligase family protein [Bacillota bacterium]